MFNPTWTINIFKDFFSKICVCICVWVWVCVVPIKARKVCWIASWQSSYRWIWTTQCVCVENQIPPLCWNIVILLTTTESSLRLLLLMLICFNFSFSPHPPPCLTAHWKLNQGFFFVLFWGGGLSFFFFSFPLFVLVLVFCFIETTFLCVQSNWMELLLLC